MIKKEVLKQIIKDFHLQPVFDVKPRDVQVPLGAGKIITLMGVWRCGKTSMLLDTQAALVIPGNESVSPTSFSCPSGGHVEHAHEHFNESFLKEVGHDGDPLEDKQA